MRPAPALLVMMLIVPGLAGAVGPAALPAPPGAAVFGAATVVDADVHADARRFAAAAAAAAGPVTSARAAEAFALADAVAGHADPFALARDVAFTHAPANARESTRTAFSVADAALHSDAFFTPTGALDAWRAGRVAEAVVTQTERDIALAEALVARDAFAIANAAPAPSATSWPSALALLYDAAGAPRDAWREHERAVAALPALAQRAFADVLVAFVRVHELTLAGVPTAHVAVARDALAAAVLRLASSVVCVPDETATVSPVLALDLRCEPSVYTADAWVVIDAGGRDVYRNSAGGATAGARLLVDLDGDDAYTPGPAFAAVTGAGLGGAGFLFDFGGRDLYASSFTARAAHGSGVDGGFGFLFDADGSDAYVGQIARRGATVGSGFVGHGFLVDAAGNDRYAPRLTDESSAVGAAFSDAGATPHAASGFVLDAAGSDSYQVTSTGPFAANGAAFHRHGSSTARVVSGVLVDLDGDDVYRATGPEGTANGAGLGFVYPASFTHDRARTVAALLFDGSGDDSFTAELAIALSFANGVGQGGVAALVDANGNDHYVGGAFVANGGGGLGLGVLADRAGDDVYEARRAGGGAAGVHDPRGYSLPEAVRSGAGVLVDVDGSDTYRARALAFGFAEEEGHTGLLVDANGNDDYATVSGSGFGAARGGVGVFVDGAGDDRVAAARPQVSFGAALALGLGVFVDGAGNDHHEAAVTRAGSAAFGSAFASARGVYVDVAGTDTRSVPLTVSSSAGARTVALFGSATTEGTGVMIDGAGDDTYAVTGSVTRSDAALRVGGAAEWGTGALIDESGSNAFTLNVPGVADVASWGAALSRPVLLIGPLGPVLGTDEVEVPSLGILLLGPGDDTVDGRGVTQGAASRYAVGVLADAGGVNTFRAGPQGLAQGAAEDGAFGALFDAGSQSTFELRDGATGQGAGLGAVGVLVRPAGASASEYVAAASARPGATTGAGVGLRLDAGAATLTGTLPDFDCGAATTLARVNPSDALDFWVCGPDPDERRPIRHPASGRAMGDVAKPGGLCAALTFPVSCRGIVTGLVAASAADWLDRDAHTMTTSGGLAYVTFRDPAGAPVQLGRYRGQSVDETCDMSCAAVEQAA